MSKERIGIRLRRFAFECMTFLPMRIYRLVNRLIVRVCKTPVFHDPRDFEWAMRLENEFEAFAPEVDAALRHVERLPRVCDILPSTELYGFSSEWRQIMFYSMGRRIDDNCAVFPVLTRILDQIPDVITASISILGPGEQVPAHTHQFRGIIIFHLGINLPEPGACRMRVNDDFIEWERGKTFIFDPINEHEIVNRATVPRVVLVGEVLRNDLPLPLYFMARLYVLLMGLSPIGRKQTATVRRLSKSLREHALQEHGAA